MLKLQIIGNPNVGKSTLFNSLTKSTEHTGNFHGVTVETKSKTIKYENELIQITDLPGLYSLNTFSEEELVAKNEIIKSESKKLVIIDANSIRKNLYLCLQLCEMQIKFNIVINNYDYFSKHGNSIDISKLTKNLGKVKIINAKKTKFDKSFLEEGKININVGYIDKYVTAVSQRLRVTKDQAIRIINGERKGLTSQDEKFLEKINTSLVAERYKRIDEILKDCLVMKRDFVYGLSKIDNFILNPIASIILFLTFFFASIYCIFFLIGPKLTDLLCMILDYIVVEPFMRVLYLTTDSLWVIGLFENGVFASINTILSFLPQVCLLFVFLTILEDSGLISRFAYSFDDLFSRIGLNGKAIYIMLLGFGCNTMSCMACRNMNNKTLKTKTAILNSYVSCMARLPLFVILASTYFGKKAYFVVVGIYLLGLIVAGIFGYILNKTILKTKENELLLEFAPLRHIDIKHVASQARINSWDLIKRVFSVVLCVGVIVFVLTHAKYNFVYTSDITDSILYNVSNKLCFILSPTGLNNAGIMLALSVGVMAKEIIVSTLSICNGATDINQLSNSLLCVTSLVYLTKAQALSLMIFSLLYAPCVSQLAVLKKEIGKGFVWMAVMCQIVTAFVLSTFVYKLLTIGFLKTAIMFICIGLLMKCIIVLVKKVKNKSFCHCKKD